MKDFLTKNFPTYPPEVLNAIEKKLIEYQASWRNHKMNMTFEDFVLVSLAAIHVAIENNP